MQVSSRNGVKYGELVVVSAATGVGKSQLKLRKCVEHMSLEVAECHRDALLAQRYTVTMVQAGNGNWLVRWR